MIHLDANFLIGAAERNSPTDSILRSWLQQGELFASSSIAWAEFLNGPVKDEQIRMVNMLLQGRIVPFGRGEAVVAAALFNATGRKRASRPDCFIAATAICSNASLATHNRKDFLGFIPLGLYLV